MRLALLASVALILITAAPSAVAQTAAPVAPAASTGAAEGVTRTTATLAGQVDPNGAATTYRFEYGTSETYGLETPVATAGAGSEPAGVEAAIEGLTASTTYHYRLVATNAAGVARGQDRTFRTAASTPNPAPPSATTSAARGVGTSSATLVARVDPNRAATQVRFEYGRSTGYGSRSRELEAGGGDAGRDLAAVVSGLRPRTTYHYRVVATNAAGLTRGRDRTFRTLAAPRSVTLSVTPDRVALGGATTVTGRVSGTGVGDLPVALEAQPFPFGATPFAQLGATRDTSSSGAFSFTTGPLLASTRLRVVTRSSVVVASPVGTALVRLRVGVRTSAGPSRRRALVTGTVAPATPGARVSVQRRTSTGRFVRVGRTSTVALDPNRSRYTVRIRRARRTATYRVSVLPPGGGPHVRGTSRELRVRGAR